jgi:hypothetical protein
MVYVMSAQHKRVGDRKRSLLSLQIYFSLHASGFPSSSSPHLLLFVVSFYEFIFSPREKLSAGLL